MKNITLKIFITIVIIAITGFLAMVIWKTEKQEIHDGHDHGHHGHEEHEEHDKHGHHDENEHNEYEHSEHGDSHAVADKVLISEFQIKNAGIVLEKAGAGDIEINRTLFGKLRANEEKIAHITPRFSGVVLKVHKRIGDKVKKGDVLVTIESNESLQPYQVKSLIKGTVIEREVSIGEAVRAEQWMFVIADLSTLWVDLNAYPKDYDLLKKGQEVEILITGRKDCIHAEIDYVSPLGAEYSQTMLARAVIPNPDGKLRPGIFCKGNITINAGKAKIAVKAEAIHNWENNDVVFVRVKNGFQAQKVLIGQRDQHFVEILGGLHLGDIYATTNSYLIKAELGKSMATHEH